MYVDPQLLQDIHLVVPSFHSYGHNADCEVSFTGDQSSTNNMLGYTRLATALCEVLELVCQTANV